MSSEKQTKNKVSKALKEMGFFYYNTRDSMTVGVPDVYVCGPEGLSIWMELKKLKGEKLHHPLTVPQSVFLCKINQSGGMGVVLIELPDGKWHMERITEIGERNEFEWEHKDLQWYFSSLHGRI